MVFFFDENRLKYMKRLLRLSVAGFYYPQVQIRSSCDSTLSLSLTWLIFEK